MALFFFFFCFFFFFFLGPRNSCRVWGICVEGSREHAFDNSPSTLITILREHGFRRITRTVVYPRLAPSWRVVSATHNLLMGLLAGRSSDDAIFLAQNSCRLDGKGRHQLVGTTLVGQS